MGKSLSKTLFYLLIFLIPISTGKVFFTSNSFYYGYHAFYNSLWIYLTDVFICGVIMAWLWEIRPLSVHRIRTVLSHSYLYLAVIIFWLILAISTAVSHETWLSLYGLVRITEYLLILAYIRENVSFSRPPATPEQARGLRPARSCLAVAGGWRAGEIKIVFWLILAISALEAVFGISQYLSQHSVGLKILGESLLVPGMKGIAEFWSHGIVNHGLIPYFPSLDSISRETINIRAYGTLPHPNVLAVMLFTGFLANLWLLYDVSRERFKIVSYETIGLVISLGIISAGLVLTFSRTVWLATAVVVLILFVSVKWLGRGVIKKMQSGARDTGSANYHPKNIAVIILVLLFSLGLNWFLFGQQIKDRLGVSYETPAQTADESIVNRQLFNSIALKMFRDHPTLGVGLRNYVVRMDEYSNERLLPYLHQPAHNIYLLLLAETGMFGLSAFLFLIFNIVKQGIAGKRYLLLVCFAGFLFLGLFDHYFLSIHQAGLLFWTVAGLLSTKQN